MPFMHFSDIVQRKTLDNARRAPVEVRFYHLVWIFVLCSFLGLVGEVIVSFFADGRWESRAGFVVGPFSPIYGSGAVLFTLFVNPLRARPVPDQLVVGAFVGGFFEYLAGWFFETSYGIVAWSYIDQPFNWHGHTCLSMALLWGALAVVWVMWVLPRAVAFVDSIPAKVRGPLTWVVFALLVVDAATTLLALDCWFWRTSGYAPNGAVQTFFATYFNDAFMQHRFETMSMWPVLASR